MIEIIQRPSGNVIDCGSTDHTVRIASDPAGGPECLWFDCDIRCHGNAQNRLHIELLHADSMLGFHPEQPIRPVCRRNDGPWQRLEPGTVHTRSDGCSSLHWSLPWPDGILRLAACIPYSPADLEQTVIDTGLLYDHIGLSPSGRNLPRIANRHDPVGGQAHGVFMTARTHAGETPGSWVLDGILRAFADPQDGDPLVWAIPFVDLDGVCEGRYGKSHWPLDHNRGWFRGSLHHTVHCCMDDARRWAARCRPAVALDLHAPGWSTPGCWLFEGAEEQGVAHRVFAGHLEQAAGQRAAEPFIRQSRYMHRMAEQLGMAPPPTASDFFRSHWPDLVGGTLEISYQRLGEDPSNSDDYRTLGRDLAEAIRSWCKRLPTPA